MKLLMHCDEVFDVLTRGPFPSGHESDPAVEHHLRCCHECRQLAEALRPAVELFHECLTAEEGRDLPEYHGGATPLESVFTRRLPQSIEELRLPPEITPRHDHPRALRHALLWQGAIALSLTAALVMLVLNLGSSLRGLKRDGRVPGETNFAAAANYPEAARQLLALQLPAACWLDQNFPRLNDQLPVAQQLASALENSEIACCTRCHAEQKPAGPKVHATASQVATLQQSCLICHKG